MSPVVLALLEALVLSVSLTQTGASRTALASITDPRNTPLVDVGADDFVIQEGGAAREILSVRPADYQESVHATGNQVAAGAQVTVEWSNGSAAVQSANDGTYRVDHVTPDPVTVRAQNANGPGANAGMNVCQR